MIRVINVKIKQARMDSMWIGCVGVECQDVGREDVENICINFDIVGLVS